MTPDGKRAVSASHDKTLKVWDLASGTLLHDLEGTPTRSDAVAVTPDGKRAVSASNDETLKVWDLASGCSSRPPRARRHGQRRGGDPRRQAGRLRVQDRTLKVWDLGLRHVLDAFATDYALWCCDVSSTGDTLVAADQGGRVHFLRYEGPGLGP